MVGHHRNTLNCDIDIQSAPQKLVEMNPAASSGPERTVPQDSKMVIDMDKHLHKIGGKALHLGHLLIYRKIKDYKGKTNEIRK